MERGEKEQMQSYTVHRAKAIVLGKENDGIFDVLLCVDLFLDLQNLPDCNSTATDHKSSVIAELAHTLLPFVLRHFCVCVGGDVILDTAKMLPPPTPRIPQRQRNSKADIN